MTSRLPSLRACVRWVALSVVAVAVCGALAHAALGARAASGAAQQPAYCSLPPGPANPAWAFHAGAPIQTARGTYAHGSGTLSGPRAAGKICQVDRVVGSPDRQIIVSVTSGAVSPVHGATLGGAVGNRMVLPVRVSSSSDARCRLGTKGTVMLFASYSGARDDVVQFSFSRACRDHDQVYSGPSVVALVPR